MPSAPLPVPMSLVKRTWAMRVHMCLGCTGKTSTMAMLTGYARPSGGRILVGGMAVEGGAHPHALGFCPQADPLLDLLTGLEHLALYARLKVCPPYKLKA